MNFLASTTLLTSLLLGQADAPGTEPRDFDSLVKQLSSKLFEERQTATRMLWEAGRAAEPALRRALRSNQPEVRARAASVLDDFKFGIFAETPPEVVRLVRRYRASGPVLKRTIWDKLYKVATTPTLLALLQDERNASLKGNFRKQLLDKLRRESEYDRALELAELWRNAEDTTARSRREYENFLTDSVPYLLTARRFDDAERILEASVTSYEQALGGKFDERLRNWAVYLMLRGRIDNRIAVVRESVTSPSDTKEAKRLAYLLQVNGDLPALRELAEYAGDSLAPLHQKVLLEQGDWKTLATQRREELKTRGASIEPLGFAAAFVRLAGQDGLADLIQQIREQLETANEAERKYCREALFLNGHTEDALESLLPDDAAETFSLLCLQDRYPEAFTRCGVGTTREQRDKWLAELVRDLPTRSVDSDKRFATALRVAQALGQVGERDEGVAMITALAGAIRDDDELKRWKQLCEYELKLGLVDRAFEHAVKLVEGADAGEALDVLFPRYSTTAQAWWDYFAAQTTANPDAEHDPATINGTRLSRLRTLLYTGVEESEYLPLLDDAARIIEARGDELKASNRARWLYAIGETWRVRDKQDRAREFFEGSAKLGGDGAIDIADMLRRAGQWQTASDWYLQAWELDQKKVFTLYLHGDMLVRAGQEEAGKRQMELARLAPLASKARHHELASPLYRRGYRDEALREWNLIVRSGTWTEAEMFYATGAIGDSLAKDDPARAAAYLEQRMLNCLQKRWLFTDLASYIRIPYQVHELRADALLAADDLDAATSEIRYCQTIWPGNTNLVEHFVPLLVAKDRQADADALFDQTYDLLRSGCDAFPASALHHNNIAWMSARCNRRLDEAMTHVRRALELSPDNPQYIDTLGEVHFRRGEFDEAIAAAERCVELDPDTAFYQEQLDRFRAAQASAGDNG